MRYLGWSLALALAPLAACTSGDAGAVPANEAGAVPAGEAAGAKAGGLVPVTIATAGGTRKFSVETAVNEEQQQQGLMYRTDIPQDGGMLFYPYPPMGPPREASFWMHNTPTSLDIIFIRADGTIARIAENTTPFSDVPVASGEPVAAVLEVHGGKAAELGFGEGDRVRWPGFPK